MIDPSTSTPAPPAPDADGLTTLATHFGLLDVDFRTITRLHAATNSTPCYDHAVRGD